MTQAVTLAQLGNSNGTFRNKIINGAMTIDQRNGGASVTPNSSYTLDRWIGQNSQTGKFTIQQNAGSVTPPVGFTNYLGVTSTSAYSVAVGEAFFVTQNIEGYNVADLGWGTANAKTVTLSFWVRSSLTGTFAGALRNFANNRSYPYSYTIYSANTWEQKSVTIVGDTTGTWATDNSTGLRLHFNLGSGSTFSGTAGSWAGANYVSATGATSVVGTSGATFYITGVQLEVGSSATGFEYRPYGTELALCQRYYYKMVSGSNQAIGVGYYWSASEADTIVSFPTTMRALPTLDSSSGTDYFIIDRNSGGDTFNSFTIQSTSQQTANIYNGSQISGTAGWGGGMRTNSASAYIAFTAEL